MKNYLLLFFALCFGQGLGCVAATNVDEDTPVIIEYLTGEEQAYLLAQLGTLQFEDGVFSVVAADGTVLLTAPVTELSIVSFIPSEDDTDTDDSNTNNMDDDTGDENTDTEDTGGIDTGIVSTQAEGNDVKVAWASGSLSVTGAKSGVAVRVISLDGRILSSTSATAGGTMVDISMLSSGTYVLQVGNKVVKFHKK